MVAAAEVSSVRPRRSMWPLSGQRLDGAEPHDSSRMVVSGRSSREPLFASPFYWGGGIKSASATASTSTSATARSEPEYEWSANEPDCRRRHHIYIFINVQGSFAFIAARASVFCLIFYVAILMRLHIRAHAVADA